MREKQLMYKVLIFVFLGIGPSLEVYQNLQHHPTKVCELPHDSQRILGAGATKVFFFSFWVRFGQMTRLRNKATEYQFVNRLATSTTSCREIPTDGWVFFVLPYDLDKSNPASFAYKLTAQAPQSSRLDEYPTCAQPADAGCSCTGNPFQAMNSAFPLVITVLPGNTDQITLSAFDGVSTNPEVRNFITGIMGLELSGMVSYAVMAELMKGEAISPITNHNFDVLDYTKISPFLDKYTPNQLYSGDVFFQGVLLAIWHDVPFGTLKMFSQSTTSDRLIKNFCFSVTLNVQESGQASAQYTIEPRLQFGDPGANPFTPQEQVIHRFTLNPDPSTTPHKHEVFLSLWNGHNPPYLVYTNNNFKLDSKTFVEVVTCYSKLYISPTSVMHQFSMKTSTLGFFDPSTGEATEQKNEAYFQYQSSIGSVSPNTEQKDVRVIMECSDISKYFGRHLLYLKSFWVMDGGMLETPSTSQDVKDAGTGMSRTPACLFQIDNPQTQCLRCTANKYYDSVQKKCVLCNDKMPRCTYCTSPSLCSACSFYNDIFGTPACLPDLDSCVAPKYTRRAHNRCDDCDRDPPNICECGTNYDQVTSSLGVSKKMCVCKLANCDICIGAAGECQRCKLGWYLKKEAGFDDKCVAEADIGTVSPPHGKVVAANPPEIKPCGIAGCLDCQPDYTKCKCNPNDFYYIDKDNNKMCSASNDVAGYGATTQPTQYTGLRRLDKCVADSCGDCKDNYTECKGCPSNFYKKPPSAGGLIDACYDVSIGLPTGWGRRQNSQELFECNLSPYFYEITKKICQFKVYLEIVNITSEQDKQQNKAVFTIKISGYKIDYDSKGFGTKDSFVDIKDVDLSQFVLFHLELKTQPKTTITQEVSGNQISTNYQKEASNFKLTFEIKDEQFKSSYNGKAMKSPYNSVLKFKDNETTKIREFSIEPVGTLSGENSPKTATTKSEDSTGTHMSQGYIDFTKSATATTQGISALSTILTIILLLSNLEVTAMIFKIIQLITIFDKLRFMNVRIENSFGDFIHFIGQLFQVNFIQRDDYHTVSIVKYNKFETGKLSVIAYRKKPDKLILFSAAIILNMVAKSMSHKIRDMEDHDFIGVEKKGKLVKKLNKVSSGILMMTILDTMFVTGHQLIHQKTSTLMTSAEYLLSYCLSFIMFFCSCWQIMIIATTFIQRDLSSLKEPKEEKAGSKAILNKSQHNNPYRLKRLSRPNQEAQGDQSEIRPLDRDEHQGSSSSLFGEKNKSEKNNKKTKIDPKKHKIDIDESIKKIYQDDFMLNFMIDGLSSSNLEKIPKLYNLVTMLKLSILGVILLSLQSSSFIQSLLFTLLELSYLAFTIIYQSKARALSSKLIFSVRILEAITLTIYGVVCVCYSTKSDFMHKLGKIISTPTFVIFIFTMSVEYCHLIITIIMSITEMLKGKKKIDEEDKKEEINHSQTRLVRVGISTSRRQSHASLPINNTKNDEKKSGAGKDLKESKDYLEYWKNHPFIVMKKEQEETGAKHRDTKLHHHKRKRACSQHANHHRDRSLDHKGHKKSRRNKGIRPNRPRKWRPGKKSKSRKKSRTHRPMQHPLGVH